MLEISGMGNKWILGMSEEDICSIMWKASLIELGCQA